MPNDWSQNPTECVLIIDSDLFTPKLEFYPYTRFI